MPNHPRSASLESSSLQPGSIEKVQKDSTSTVANIIAGITPTEEFLGQKFVAQIHNLEGENRDTYIASVTNPDGMKSLIVTLIAKLGIDEKVSVSRVIAFVQANT